MCRRDPGVGTGLERVATQVAERLPQQDVVALRPLPNSPRDLDTAAARRGLGRALVGGAIDEPLQATRWRSVNSVGLREIEEIGHDLAKRVGLVPESLARKAGIRPAASSGSSRRL